MKIMIDIGAPLLLHMAVTELTLLVMGAGSDAALRTAVTAVIVIPAALWMWRRDKGLSGADLPEPEKTQAENRTARNGKRAERGTEGVRKIFPLLLCFLAGAVMNLLWSGILNSLRVQEYFSNATQEKLLASQLLIQVLGLGFLVPVAEELVFRVLIYGRLRRSFGVGQSVLFSSLLFAVYHGNMIQMIFAFPMAVVLALIYEKRRRAACPIAFHMGANLAAVLVNML